MTNQLAKAEDRQQVQEVTQSPIVVQLKKMKSEFESALPEHITADKFIRTIKTAINLEPKLYKAITASDHGMRSFLAACTKAASDGLILDGKEAVLLTFRTKIGGKDSNQYAEVVQYIPMRDGLMKLARNSGEISAIQAEIVYRSDTFTYDAGSGEPPHHPAQWFAEDRGEPVGGYAVGRLKDGTVITEIMTRSQIMKIGLKTKNAHQYQPAGSEKPGDSWEEWWRKTLIRRLAKYLPKSSDREGQRFSDAATRVDDLYDADAEEVSAEPTLPAPPKKTRGAAKKAMQDITPKEPEPEREDPPHDPDTGELIEEEPIDNDPI